MGTVKPIPLRQLSARIKKIEKLISLYRGRIRSLEAWLVQLRIAEAEEDMELAMVLFGSMPAESAEPPTGADPPNDRSIPRRVFDVIDSDFATMQEIADLAGLTVPQVKGALYAGKLKRFVEKRVVKGVASFRRRKNVGNPWTTSENSISSQVRNALKQHKGGLTVAELDKLLAGKIQSTAAQGTKGSISNAIFTMRQRGAVVFDDESKKYKLPSRSD